MEPITNERLNMFVLAAKHFLASTPKSKLWYAADKILRVAKKKLKKLEELKNEKKREFGATKSGGVYDLDASGNFQYTPDSLNKLFKALTELDDQKCDLPVHIIPAGEYDDKQLTADIREAFEGIIIPAVDYDKFDWDNVKAEEEKKESKPAPELAPAPTA